jgi:general secretion pathway protein F
MPTYKYRAKNGPQTVEGNLEAPTREEAIEKLNQMGYLPVRIDETAAPKAKAKTARQTGLLVRRARSKDITIFSRQLASFMKTGVGILPALSTIAQQSRSPYFQTVLEAIRDDVKDGKPLSAALGAYPRFFSTLYVAMVRSGESSGNLGEVLLRVADHRQKQEEILSRVRTALAYPILMAIVGAVTIVFMFTHVMPRLMRVFSRIGQELPLPTKVLVAVSKGLQEWGIGILVVLAIGAFLLKQGSRTKTQRVFVSRLKLRIPIIGNLMYKSELARFNRTLEILIKSGIPILKAIGVAIPIAHNELMREELQASLRKIEEGSSFGKSLQDSKIFPPFMSSLIVVGEASGRLEEALAEVATSYEKETDEAVKMMTALLEPLIILVMGLIVGFIVIAMLLPVFQMSPL